MYRRLLELLKLVKPRQPHLPQTNVSRSYFPIGTWVKAKRSGGKRYVTRHNTKECFEDDGKVSGQAASAYCHYDNYEAL